MASLRSLWYGDDWSGAEQITKTTPRSLKNFGMLPGFSCAACLANSRLPTCSFLSTGQDDLVTFGHDGGQPTFREPFSARLRQFQSGLSPANPCLGQEILFAVAVEHEPRASRWVGANRDH